jgi:hypothetical protein
MDFSSLPKYPPPDGPGAATCLRENSQELSRRVIRILLELVFLLAVMLLLYEFRPIATVADRPPPAAPPLDFKLIEARYNKVGLFVSRDEVRKLLGPPTELPFWEPGLEQLTADVEQWNMHSELPSDRIWVRWTDPNDKGKCVTIFFAGNQVRFKFKKGF